jgi:hypothetical protein
MEVFARSEHFIYINTVDNHVVSVICYNILEIFYTLPIVKNQDEAEELIRLNNLNNRINEYELIHNENGVILFSGTEEECKKCQEKIDIEEFMTIIIKTIRP